MAPLEPMPMSSTSKRRSSFSTATRGTASESHGEAIDPKFVRPPKRQTLGKKMKGWLLGGSSNAKVHTNPRNEASKPRKESRETQNETREPQSQPRSIEQELKPPPPQLHTPEPKEAPDTVSPRRKKKRLKLLLKKVEVHSESGCGLLIEEFIDMGYFCRCLGERFHEESLQFIGRANEDEENSVVDDNRTTSLRKTE